MLQSVCIICIISGSQSELPQLEVFLLLLLFGSLLLQLFSSESSSDASGLLGSHLLGESLSLQFFSKVASDLFSDHSEVLGNLLSHHSDLGDLAGSSSSHFGHSQLTEFTFESFQPFLQVILRLVPQFEYSHFSVCHSIISLLYL